MAWSEQSMAKRELLHDTNEKRSKLWRNSPRLYFLKAIISNNTCDKTYISHIKGEDLSALDYQQREIFNKSYGDIVTNSMLLSAAINTPMYAFHQYINISIHSVLNVCLHFPILTLFINHSHGFITAIIYSIRDHTLYHLLLHSLWVFIFHIKNYTFQKGEIFAMDIYNSGRIRRASPR